VGHAEHPNRHGEADPPSVDLRAAGERIQVLLDASASGGAVVRERAEELVRLVTDLYGAALERVLGILDETGHLDEGLRTALSQDDLVASLLIVHGLHPLGVEERVEAALESVRPYLGSHGGDVELVEVSEAGVVRLRLLGSCDGCPSSSVTLKLAVEEAVETAAPEITAIEVETPVTTATAKGSVIPVDALRLRLDPAGPSGQGWTPLPELSALVPGEVGGFVVDGMSLLACRAGEQLYAFADRCPRCESSMAGASLARLVGGRAEDAALRCPGCRGRYDVRRAGASLEGDGLHLDPLPLLVRDGVASVALPAAVA
jgi:Fe-S cluster biogenesis protein NfuA/nitrite reductase/ring-hydroxylating ferredoxin subunit